MADKLVPQLVIIAGPNGSGKSTLTKKIKSDLKLPVIDPDAEAKKINPSAPETAAVAAGRQAIQLGRNYIKNKQSFAVETTLSGNTYLNMMRRANQEGYEINLIFIGINTVDTNIERVNERVANGGHNVPEEDIRRRYERSMENLPVALDLADNATIFDNSSSLGHQQKLTIENKKLIQQSADLSQWITSAIPQEQLQSLQDDSIAQSIYPTAYEMIERSQSQLEEVSTGVFQFKGTSYKILINENDQRLSIFSRGDNQELASYDTLNDKIISTSGLTEQDLSNWNSIETIQQINTPTGNTEL